MVELPGRGETFVTDSGDRDAPVIVLLHAVVTTGLLSWYPVIPRLAEEFRVITMDQRWHGRGIVSEEFRLDDCADDVAALADVLGIDRFAVAGFSMGGGTAQLTWRRHHDRVSALVLASTGSYFGRAGSGRAVVDQMAGSLLRLVRTPLRTISAEALDDTDISDGAWALRQVRSTRLSRVGEIGDELGRFRSGEWLAEIDVPTAVCVTTRDRVVPPSRQQLLVDGIPGARRFDVAAGHACCVLQADVFGPVFVQACTWAVDSAGAV
ncbi:alpha/beta fold hydrolase [Williamsia sterculiae]|nr:alpha/beta fold hydrolase [Williamsia sterculiae]